MGRLPAGAADRLRMRRLFRPVITNVIVNNITADLAAVNLSASTAASSTTVRYVRRNSNGFTMDLLAFMLILFMLISTSSMFVFHMLVAVLVMFNILKLIMKLLPNYPTRMTKR